MELALTLLIATKLSISYWFSSQNYFYKRPQFSSQPRVANANYNFCLKVVKGLLNFLLFSYKDEKEVCSMSGSKFKFYFFFFSVVSMKDIWKSVNPPHYPIRKKCI